MHGIRHFSMATLRRSLLSRSERESLEPQFGRCPRFRTRPMERATSPAWYASFDELALLFSMRTSAGPLPPSTHSSRLSLHVSQPSSPHFSFSPSFAFTD